MKSLATISLSWDDQDRPLIEVRYSAPDEETKVDTGRWLSALADRLTEKSASYLQALIALNERMEHVSLTALAEELGVERKDVDGWNRNLGRSIKANVREYGFLRRDEEDGTAQLFDYKWDDANKQWLYELPKEFRPYLSEAFTNRSL